MSVPSEIQALGRSDLRQGRAPTEILVLGYGNELLGDDGVGPCIARRLADLRLSNVRAIDVLQLMPELADDIAHSAAVIFIDASVRSPAGCVSVLRLDGPATSLSDGLGPVVPEGIQGHGWTPSLLLQLAASVFGHRPPAWLVTVGAQALRLGEGLTSRVERAIPVAIHAIRARIERVANGEWRMANGEWRMGNVKVNCLC